MQNIGRRDFLKLLGLTGAGLATTSLGCKKTSNLSERDKKINQLQDAVNDLREKGKIGYTPGHGHIIDLSLDGQAIRANVSQHSFRGGHKISYQPVGTNYLVRVYGEDIEIYSNNSVISDKENISHYQQMTDKVLEALVAQTSHAR